MIDDKAIEAALDAWYGNQDWRSSDDHAERHDMRAALAAADKVRAAGFDVQAEVDAWWLTDRHFTDLANRAFAAGLAKGDADRAELIEALRKIAKTTTWSDAMDIADAALALVRKGK